MANEQYEVEIKSLLGSAENAEKLRNDLKTIDPSCELVTSYTQLNHYFEGGDPQTLADKIAPLLDEIEAARLHRIATEGKNVSVRTREMNNEVRFVMKASIGDDSSANGVSRLEVETLIKDMTLEQLDQVVLDAGYKYQAKWSRSREEYKLGDTAVCLDKNAGYGYVAEFERLVGSEEEAQKAQQDLYTLMEQVGVSELPQDRLERMFSYYNEHWPEYYGTDKIFIIE
jgi:predicted adenylyl cyclase CyaB